MKNRELFPWSRNRYFPGKQLVTRDMEAEQRYFNNKRRLLNSLLHGSGIVCGLVVTVVEHGTLPGGQTSGIGLSVAVEPGLAIDGTGREILLPEQVYLRLSDLDGFSGDSGLAEHVYLCIEYAEIEREPMHSILDSAVAGENYNRVEESCRFYLTYQTPETGPGAKQYPDVATLKQEYYGENLDKRLNNTRKEEICLAKISMVHWESAYAINQVENAPFGQYVMSAALSASIMAAVLGLPRESCDTSEPAPRSTHPAGEGATEQFLRQGLLPVNIPTAFKSMEEVVFSEIVPHGLGIGPVAMSVGLAVDGGVVYGAKGVFSETAGYEYAVKTKEDDGTFQIGVRAPAALAGQRLVFSWLAVRDPDGLGEGLPQPHLVISPGSVRLPVRGALTFSCLTYGLGSGEVSWSVREPEGGSIDPGGFYRAPNTPGVYEIRAGSVERPEVLAAAFVVVHE